MEFTVVFENLDIRISTSWGSNVNRFERNYFKFDFLDISDLNSFEFNGYTYFGYKDGDSVTVEVTDLVASTNEEVFELSITADEVFLYGTTIVNGMPIDAILAYNLPKTIPFSLSFSDEFPISSSNPFDKGESADIFTAYIDSEDELIYQALSLIQLQPISCIYDHAMLWWIDSLGKEKAWIFKKNLLTFGSKKQLEIETGDNNYKQFRTKEYGVQLIHRGADHITQMYLADLFFADEIYLLLDAEKKIPIKIDETKLDVQKSKKDVIVNVNIAHYDTI